MMFDLTGKVAIVTGGAQGIGLAITQALARQGASVAILDLNLSQAEQVVEGLTAQGSSERSKPALALQANVADKEQVAAAVEHLIAAWGRVDILVNNAAILSTVPFQALSEAEWDKVLDVNLKSVFNGCQAVVEGMKAQGGGRIINIASVAGKRGGGFLGSSAYSAAKAGVLGFSKALARELASDKITVNVVAPGPIDTLMMKKGSEEVRQRILAGIPLGRFGRPEEIAAAVVYLASSEAAFVTGEVLDVNGGVMMD